MIIGLRSATPASNPLHPMLRKPLPRRDVITVLPPRSFYDVEVETWKMHRWHLPTDARLAAPALPWLHVCVFVVQCVSAGMPSSSCCPPVNPSPCRKTVMNRSIEQKDNLQNSDYETFDWTKLIGFLTEFYLWFKGCFSAKLIT